MKALRLIIIIILISLLAPSLTFGQELGLSSQSSILMDLESGRILYEKDAHKRMPMASTTKIMTALIALENGNLKEEITIKKEWVGVEGSSIYLREGEVLTLEDMLYGLMLRSGNDVAMAIADHIGTSMDGFVAMMNKKAKALGANNSNFLNPHGLHHDNHYSTAYDLALITREAFKYPDFAKIVKSKSYTSPREINNYYGNKNKTLWEYLGGDGVKTGYTMRSGRCLVSSASKGDRSLIAVSLNARDWFNDNYKLLDYGFENYRNYIVYTRGQFVKKVKLEGGKKNYMDLVTGSDFFYPFRDEEKEKIVNKIDIRDNLQAPIEEGQSLGTIYSYLDNRLVRKTDLVARSTIRKASLFDKLLESLGRNK